jgi:response regulator of citrate/malate metabolism
MKTVLLVEDDDSTSDLLNFYLEHQFHIQPICAKSNTIAINTLSTIPIDLVLLDYYIEDGAAEPIVQHIATLKNKPIIVLMTAANNYEQIAENIHPNDVVRKPFDLDVFEKVLKKYVDVVE